jgi:hypothetical protein
MRILITFDFLIITYTFYNLDNFTFEQIFHVAE